MQPFTKTDVFTDVAHACVGLLRCAIIMAHTAELEEEEISRAASGEVPAEQAPAAVAVQPPAALAVGQEDFSWVGGAMRTSLSYLRMERMGLGDKGMAAVAKELRVAAAGEGVASIKTLYLGHNDIGSDGAMSLAEALHTPGTVNRLHKLFMTDNIRIMGTPGHAALHQVCFARSIELIGLGPPPKPKPKPKAYNPPSPEREPLSPPPARPPPMVSPPDSPKPKFQQPPLPPPPPPPRRSLELMPCHRDARRSTSRTNGSPPRPGTALASSDKEWTSLLKQPAYSREAMRGVDRLPPPRPRSSAPVLGRWTAQVLREQVRADLLPAGCCYCKPFLLTVVYSSARSACLPGAPGSKAMALHGMAVHGAGSAPGGQPCPTRPRHAASPSRWRERRAPNALRRHAECEGHFRAEEGLTQTHAPMPSILWKAHKRKHGLIGSHRPQLYSLGYCSKKNFPFFWKS